MLTFSSGTCFAKYYSQKIHQFLRTEFYDSAVLSSDSSAFKEEQVLSLFSSACDVLNEDPGRCYQIAMDLYNWSGDFLAHHLDDAHLMALYNFLNYVQDLIADERFIYRIYFAGEEERAEINQAWEEFNRDEYSFRNKQQLSEYLHNMHNMIDEIFDDIDFITFPMIVSDAIAGGEDVSMDLVTEYRALLPKDIVKYYQELHGGVKEETGLYDRLTKVWDFIDSLTYRYLPDMLWKDEKPVHENIVHQHIRAILEACFLSTDIQVDHEVEIGNGRIDFRLNNPGHEKAIIEVKLGSNPRLVEGVTMQLAYYMKAERCEHGYYLVFCFSEAEAWKAKESLGRAYKSLNKNIDIRIFDVTKKASPSVVRP